MPDNTVVPFDYMRRLDRREEAAEPVDPINATIGAMHAEDAHRTILDNPLPDKVARVSRLSRETGDPPFQVEGNEDAIEAAQRAVGFASLVERSSALGKWAAQNPRGAAAAQDDHQSLGALGTAWDMLKNLPGRMAAGSVESGAGMLEGGNPLDWALDQAAGAVGLPTLRDSARRRAAAMRETAGAIRDNFRGASWLSETALSGFEYVPIAAAAALTRNPAIATAIPALSVRGSSLATAREQGLSGFKAEAYADIQGGIEYATERVPMGVLVDALVKRTPVGKAIIHQLTTELPTEQVATITQDLTDWAMLPENEDKTFGDYIHARPQAFLDTLVATVSGTAAQTALARSVQRAGDAAGKVSDRVGQARRAQSERRFLERATAAAEASKLRERDPEAFRELLRQQAEEAGATHIYIPGDAIQTFHQSDFYDENNDPFAQYDVSEAAATGGDVVIPIQNALTDLVGSPAWAAVKDHARLSAGGMSAKEAETFNEKMDDLMADLSDEAAKQDKAQANERSVRDKIVDRVAEMFGVSFTPPAARNIAELFAQRMQTRAGRLGQELTPEALDGFQVRQVMPEGVAEAVKADNLDLVINAMRQRKDAEVGEGETLLQFIRKRGGINDSGGDLKAIGLPANVLRDFDPRQTAMGGISGQGDFGHDTVLRAAIEAGYFPELEHIEREAGPSQLDTAALHEALAEELAGRPRYASVRDDRHRRAGEDLRAVLSEQGLDPDAMSDAEVRAAVERMASEGSEDALRQSDMRDQVRGQFSFDQNKRIIELFQSRNLSTPLHELSHMWLEELRFDAEQPDAPEQLKADWQTVQRYFAANGHAIDGGQIPTEAHELWARSGERYLMEGKAPSSALVRLFETFRAWLVNIYKTVDRLRAPITPEIREVFDRLIAMDEEIQAAQERQGLEALFKDAASVGMTEPEFQAYQRQVDDARAGAHAALLDKTMRSLRRREQERYSEARKTIRAEEQERIDGSPLYRALASMKATRVSKEWIADEMGLDALDLMPVRVPPLYVSGGTHPDMIAELTGYGSGREMLEAIIGAERAHRAAKEAGDDRSMRQRAIETATDAEFSRRYGDPLNDGSIEREAMAAVHSEMQGEVIASELRVLSRKTGRRPTPYALAREWARGKVRNGTVQQEASPGAIQRYARNAAKAAREAEAAILKQDVDEAFRQKQFQMMNNALVAESKAAADEVQSAVKRMDKIARATTRKSVDQDYLKQAQALLETVDLRKRSQVGLDRAGSWADWAAAREAEGFDVVVPLSFEALIGKTNWTRLSVENLLALDETVKQVMHLGRLKQSLIDNQEQREWDAVIGEAVDGAGGLKQRPPRDLMEPGWADRFRSGVAAMDAGLLRMETVFDWLDGGKADGVFNRIAFRPVSEAQAREQDMLADYFGRIRALFEGVPAKALKRWGDTVVLPFTNRDTGLPERLSRKQLIAAALNGGNAGNLQRLTDGYGWSPAALVDYLSNELSAEEWQFVQGVWDTIDTLWPDIEAMEHRVNGIAPDKVEATEIVTPHGTFRGGYYPAIYDSTRDLKTEERRGKETDLFESVYTRASTRSSATKARAEQVTRPILLDLGVINRHLGEVIHDVTHREAVMQAYRFLTNERVASAVDAALGQEIRKQFRPWVKFVANSWAMERAGNEGVGKFFGKLRANTTAVGMGFRISTAFTQLAGYSNSIEVVGARWITEATARTAAHPIASFNFVMERSGEMRHRMDTLDRDIRTAINNAPLGKLGEVKRFMYHGIGYMDRAVAIPTWLGAYNKALASGASDEDAAYASDKAVRLSQGAGSPKDLAAIQRGTGKWGELLKAFTMFYSYFSAVYQRERTLGRDVAGRSGKPRNLPRLLARAWWLLVVPAVLPDLIKMGIGGNGGPDDDEWWAGWAFKKFLSNSLGPIPVARDLIEPAWDKAAGNKSFGYSMSPLQRIGESFVNVAGDAGRVARGDETKHVTKDTLEAAGYATGLVPGQVASAAQFLVDVGEGDADPQGFADWWQGLTTGKLKDD